MAFHTIATSGCSDGNCARLQRDDEISMIRVRGYAPGHADDPAHELDVDIPVETWNFMVSQLPR